ncbi:MAG: hypothetical protein ABIV63_08705, partial [Caldimonas sp.]
NSVSYGIGRAIGVGGRVAAFACTLVASLASVPTSVMAAAATNLQATVIAVPDSVSVSRTGLTTFAAYRVTVKNTGGNTTNQVVYVASSQVNDASSVPTGDLARAVQITNPDCQLTGSASSSTGFSCSFGQMKAGDFRSFLMVFEAPLAGPDNANKQLQVNSNISFCSNVTCGTTNKVIIDSPPAVTALVTTEDTKIASEVKSAIPTGGGSFFTGPNHLTSTGNLHVTQVTIPPGTPISDDAIVESNVTSHVPFACDSSRPKYLCYGFSSQVSVNQADAPEDKPGAKIYLTGDALLTITLTQDVSTIKPGTKIANVNLYYQYDIVDPVTLVPVLDLDGKPTVSSPPMLIPPCTASLPAVNQPCIPAGGRTVQAKGTPGAGNFNFVIKGRDNGVFSW